MSNLLPPEQRIFLRFEEWRRIVILFAGAGFGILVVGIVMLLPSYAPLLAAARERNRILALEEQSSASFRVSETISRIREEETLLNAFLARTQRGTRASGLLDYFLARPEGIMFTSLAVKGRSLSIDGVAHTRQDLLSFEEQLRASGRFENLHVPLAAIARKENISFSMRGALTPSHALSPNTP